MTQYSAKNPAVRQTLQNTIVPAIGWILSANEIKLVTPAIISDSRHTVISTARATIIFLALEFGAAAAVFTIRCRYCASGTAGFNRKPRLFGYDWGTHAPRVQCQFGSDLWRLAARIFSISQLSLVTRYCALAESAHENIYAINHNSVRDIDRDSLICAKPRRIAGYRHKPYGSSRRSTESAGDDEADDGRCRSSTRTTNFSPASTATGITPSSSG